MTPTSILRQIYETYDAGYKRRNALFSLHRKIIQSPRVTGMLFGIRVDTAFVKNGFFDLTTLLLKSDLKRRVSRLSNPRLLEIGVGRFAVLSGWLSRRVTHKIVACDFDRTAFESAKVHVQRNDLNIDLHQSDVFSAVPASRYDLIYWNLPYYDDPEPLLSRLFAGAPGFLSDHGTLIIGFNGKPLPVQTVTTILTRYPDLEVRQIRRYWWNLHALIVIGRSEARGQVPTARSDLG